MMDAAVCQCCIVMVVEQVMGFWGHSERCCVCVKDILEELDPVLEPVLAKAFIKRGNQTLIKIGDKEVDYNVDFKLYLTTKLANPHYTPEISTKAMILNFAVKEDGLEAQLLNLVVKMERPDLDEQKNELVVNVAQGKRTQARL